jgi:peptide deformylase
MSRRVAERLPLLEETGAFAERLAKAKALPLVHAGDPVLREGTVQIPADHIRSDEVQDLLAQMVLTMRKAPGVGLAAPQVGSNLCLAVIEDPPQYTSGMSDKARAQQERDAVPLLAIVNPIIERVSPSQSITFHEGCLSVPGYVAEVKRERAICVRGLDAHGEPFVWRPSGWPARIAQHEIDHLKGLLYIDKMASKTFTYCDGPEEGSDP